MDEDKKQKKAIYQLLILLGSAVGFAVLFAVFMIFYYGPSGQYYVKNILLAPDMIGKLDFHDGKNGGKYTFDKAVFRYYNDNEKSWKSVNVDGATYQKVFTTLENESSMKDVPTEVMNLFNLANPATLTLYVKNEKATNVFQEIVFVKDGDFYRVLLRGDNPSTSWAYFHHRKIYDHIIHTIVQAGPP